MANIILYEDSITGEMKTASSVHSLFPSQSRQPEQKDEPTSKIAERIGELRASTGYDPKQEIYFSEVIRDVRDADKQ